MLLMIFTHLPFLMLLMIITAMIKISLPKKRVSSVHCPRPIEVCLGLRAIANQALQFLNGQGPGVNSRLAPALRRIKQSHMYSPRYACTCHHKVEVDLSQRLSLQINAFSAFPLLAAASDFSFLSFLAWTLFRHCSLASFACDSMGHGYHKWVNEWVWLCRVNS